jgi:crotonobetainyl-CoA:carnitine CoA-transferase CaiB-like acyl-CoA transferase
MAVLEGLTVLELPGSLAASYCGKTFADLGATVERLLPWSEPGSGLDVVRQAGKAVRVLEPDDLDGLHERLAGADVIVFDVGAPDWYGVALAADRLLADYPRLVVTAISPFGLTGPRAGWRSSRGVLYGMSCWSRATGSPDREPLALGLTLHETLPGLSAAAAAMAALLWREQSGRGQIVDISKQESLLVCEGYQEVGLSYRGVSRARNGMPFPMTLVECIDGRLGINVLTETQWELLCSFAGRVDLLADPRLADLRGRAEHTAELTEIFAAWAADKPAAATFEEAQAWRIPLAYLPELSSIPGMAPHVGRDFFNEVSLPGAGELTVPRAAFLVNGRRPGAAATTDAGPGPDRPTGDGTDELELPRWPAEEGEATGPLLGLRIVDLSMFWAGPLVTELLAQYGASVIKVESIQRVDGWRGATADPSIEASPAYNSVNLNKLGITLDLTREEGRSLLRDLVVAADVLVENYSTRVMANFGLTDDVLLGWNPRLLILSMPGFGQAGPWGHYVGFAPTIETLAGAPHFTRYAGGPPTLTGHALADPCAGIMGAWAILAARYSQRRGSYSGGVHLDLSQLESMISLIWPDLAAAVVRPPDWRDSSNGEVGCAPYGCYPCRGQDSWVAITVVEDAEWLQLRQCLDEEWAYDPALEANEERWRRRAEIDAALGAWTAGQEKGELAAWLQARGVTAGPVADPEDLYADPHLEARDCYRLLDRPVVGPHRYPVLPWKFSATPGEVYRASPTLGQDNDRVLRVGMGLPAEEVARLRVLGIIGEEAI